MTRSSRACRSRRVPCATILVILLGTAPLACAGAPATEAAAAEAPDDRPPVEDDRTLCAWRGRTDREVIESKSPGSRFPNVRRVFAIKGQGEERRRVLVCRETDTNLDGLKDVARQYDERGQPEFEQADTNYDGKIDTWITFARGRVVRMEVDRTGNGQPDEIRFFVRGELSRVQRDTNRDGRPNVWEIYHEGKLDRIGTDLDGDGRVDRWDRDEVARRLQEEKDRQEEAARAAAASPEEPAAEGAPPP
jgi:hypothetical protein